MQIVYIDSKLSPRPLYFHFISGSDGTIW